MSTLLQDAVRIACEAHAGQVDKQGEPYIFHVMRVALAVREDDARAVALLHDVVEDCAGWKMGRLREAGVPKDVLSAVWALTRRKAEGETYADYIERVARNRLAKIVKLADLLDNLNPERLALIPPERAASLSKRYLAAYNRLSGNYVMLPPENAS